MKIFTFICVFFISVVVNAQSTRENIAKEITENFQKGDYQKVQNDFSGSLKSALTVNGLQKAWESIIANSGEYQSVISTNEMESQGYKVIKRRLKFAKENLSLEITFNEENKVIGLYFKP